MAKRKGRESFEVHLDASEFGALRKVGMLHRPIGRTDLPASFEYDAEWLRGGLAFKLDPRLELWTGEQYPAANATTFAVFMDASPDRWGRVLMERREAAASARERRPARALRELDFLLGVQDVTRMGALRLRSARGGPFQDDSELSVPPFTSLRELAGLSAKLEDPDAEKAPEYERWLNMLVAPGTSLGGARPKANFVDGDTLWMAKFPAREDRYDVGAWEYLVNRLARAAGISVPEARLESLSARHRTFCAARFDRTSKSRRMFASAMTLLEMRDGDQAVSYLDLAGLIADHGATKHIAEDLEQLFRRVIFNVMIGNRDDHLRNHGFLRDPSGWRLSPAYDVNPNPSKTEHTLKLDAVSAAPDLGLVLPTAGLYRVDRARAKKIVDKVRTAVAKWEAEAKAIGCSRDEILRMRNVFRYE